MYLLGLNNAKKISREKGKDKCSGLRISYVCVCVCVSVWVCVYVYIYIYRLPRW